MDRLHALNSKEAREISSITKKQWNADFDFSLYAIYINNDNKIFIVSKDVQNIDFRKLRVNSLGLYFGEMSNSTLRLSIEGSQIIGKHAKNNILDLTDEQETLWLSGKDLDMHSDSVRYVIIRHGDDFLGCGKLTGNKLLNHVPKTRRIK
ncbi:MAG: hypothetical protein V1859_07560 [archaeon]